MLHCLSFRALKSACLRLDIPSIALASSTENLTPSSLMLTCALLANAMQRSNRNSWRAELDTAVRMGSSSWSMAAKIYMYVMLV
jgi:hypothetical protein